MKLFHKESKQKKETRSLPMGKKSRSAFAVYAALVLMLCCCTTTAFAASDPLTVINNLSDFIFGLIRAVGMILLGFGVVQIGLSLKSHDPSQRANGFLTLAGGVVITFAKQTDDRWGGLLCRPVPFLRGYVGPRISGPKAKRRSL